MPSTPDDPVKTKRMVIGHVSVASAGLRAARLNRRTLITELAENGAGNETIVEYSFCFRTLS